jgi:predicted PurR-regulated permease PerM
MDYKHNQELEKRLYSKLLDTLIKAGLILVLVMTCYSIFSPFLSLMLWALILAVALYPLHQRLANRMRGRQGFASTIIVLASVILIIVPCTLLMSSMTDSISNLIHGIQNNSLHIPLPPDTIAQWPLVGKDIHQFWQEAATDLPGLIQNMQPKIGHLTKKALAMVASMGTDILKFLFSCVIAGIVMSFGKSGAQSALNISRRVVGESRASEFTNLCTATIRAVAQGVIGVALIQAILIGLVLYFSSIPGAGVLAVITLIIGIAQIPAALITLPAIIYIWISGDYGTGSAILFTVLLIVAGMADNVLKPLLLGRGVDAPMPVILLGALGGMVASGILGMFIGATMLALGYQIFMGWVNGPVLPEQQLDSQQEV